MPQSITDFSIFRAGQTENIVIYVRDTLTNDLTNVVGNSNTFSLINIADDSTEFSRTFGPTGGTGVTHPGTGIYMVPLNTTTYSAEYLAAFNCILTNEPRNYNVFVKSVTARHFAYASQLRLQVDKARKSISDDIANMDQADFEPSVSLLYGYEDRHMIAYLDRGVQFLNAIPPYTSLTVNTFPFSEYGTILIDSAVIAALESQSVLAIDSDFSHSAGGNQLIIDHFSKLSSMLSHLLNRFTKVSVSWKQQYRVRGLVQYQFLPGGVRAARQLNSYPAGFWSRLLSAANT